MKIPKDKIAMFFIIVFIIVVYIYAIIQLVNDRSVKKYLEIFQDNFQKGLFIALFYYFVWVCQKYWAYPALKDFYGDQSKVKNKKLAYLVFLLCSILFLPFLFGAVFLGLGFIGLLDVFLESPKYLIGICIITAITNFKVYHDNLNGTNQDIKI